MASTSQASRPGAVLAVLSIASFMASLDLFIVNVAFADIGKDFSGSSLGDLSWVLNAYAILFAALLVPLGRLSDRFGQRNGFLAGVALFTVGSALCAVAPGLWWLVAFRGMQAVGAAALTPASLGILINATPPEGRQKAVRIWAATGALAAALGPVVGGVLVEASWRWVFIVNVPVGVASLIATLRLVPVSRHDASSRLPDVTGAVMLALGIGAIALGLVKGPDWGWTSGGTIAAWIVGAASVVWFWVRSQTHHSPIVEPALLKVRAFAWSNATGFLFSISFAAALLSMVLWLQDVWGWSAIKTGLGVSPGPMMVPVFAAVGQRLSAKVPVGWIAAAGCTLFGVGSLIVLNSVGPQAHYASEILPGWLVGGMGVGLALPTILSQATADLPLDRAATGSAVVNMSRQVGSVLGVSVLIAVLGSPTSYSDAHARFQHGWWVIVAACAAGAVAAFGMTPRGAQAGAPTAAAAVPVHVG